MKILKFVLSFVLSLSLVRANAQVTKVWETKPVFSASESVVFDSKCNCFYVSNFNDQGGFIKKADTLHNEYVSKMDINGNIQQLKWIGGLHNPTGLYVFNDKLYVVEREGLVVVNIKKSMIEQRIPIVGARFLNDIAVDQDGTAYISDTFKPCVFRVKNGRSEVWYTDSLMNSSNGLLIDNGYLLVGNKGAENLFSISLKDKTTEVIATGISSNIDGIKKYRDGYLISWKSELYIYENGTKKMLFTLEDKKDFVADFDYIEKKNLIIVPLLMSNKVVALKMK